MLETLRNNHEQWVSVYPLLNALTKIGHLRLNRLLMILTEFCDV